MTKEERKWFDIHLKEIMRKCEKALATKTLDDAKEQILWIRDTAYTAFNKRFEIYEKENQRPDKRRKRCYL